MKENKDINLIANIIEYESHILIDTNIFTDDVYFYAINIEKNIILIERHNLLRVLFYFGFKNDQNIKTEIKRIKHFSISGWKIPNS